MTSVASLFPLTITLTKDMIERSLPLSPYYCQGAVALRSALGNYQHGRDITWGFFCGMIDGLLITTKEGHAMPLLFSPTKITFIII